MLRLLMVSVLAAGFADAAFAAEAFDPEAATQAWLATLDPEAAARSDAYYEGGYWLILVNALWTVGVCVLLLSAGWARRWREWLDRKLRHPAATALGMAVGFLAALTVLSLPLAYYQGFLREHDYGLSTQTFSAWFGEHMLNEAIGWLLLGLLLTGIYGLIRRLRRAWWALASAVMVAFMAFVIAIMPVFIAPLFNTYASMEDGPQKQDILALAAASGVPATDVFVYDESRQSNRVTANVSGLFGTTRISLADNLLTRASPAGVRMVMAHEIGHYVLDQLVSILIMFAVAFVIVFWLVDRLFHVLAAGGRWGIRDIADPAGLPLAVLLFVAVLTAASPFTNAITRYHEHQADIFGLNASREPDGFAEVALLLAEYRKMQPGPVERILFYDHPSGYDRIHMAMAWKSAEMAAGRLPEGSGGLPPGVNPAAAAREN